MCLKTENDIEAIRRRIDELMVCYNNQDWRGMVSYYTPDAQSYQPDNPAQEGHQGTHTALSLVHCKEAEYLTKTLMGNIRLTVK